MNEEKKPLSTEKLLDSVYAFQKATEAKQTGEQIPARRCKYHNYTHAYLKCIKCGHQYCSHYWFRCPQCHPDAIPQTGEGNAPRVDYVKDIPRDWQLVSDSQDIDATLESIGSKHMRCDVGCLFVKVGEGEYTGVYYCERSIPLLDCEVYKLL